MAWAAFARRGPRSISGFRGGSVLPPQVGDTTLLQRVAKRRERPAGVEA